MTDEELEALVKETSEQIDRLSAPEKPLTKEEKKRKTLLQMQKMALGRIKEAKEKGSLQQEIRASMDYSLLTKYGDKHPFLMGFIKSQMWWYGW